MTVQTAQCAASSGAPKRALSALQRAGLCLGTLLLMYLAGNLLVLSQLSGFLPGAANAPAASAALRRSLLESLAGLRPLVRVASIRSRFPPVEKGSPREVAGEWTVGFEVEFHHIEYVPSVESLLAWTGSHGTQVRTKMAEEQQFPALQVGVEGRGNRNGPFRTKPELASDPMFLNDVAAADRFIGNLSALVHEWQKRVRRLTDEGGNESSVKFPGTALQAKLAPKERRKPGSDQMYVQYTIGLPLREVRLIFWALLRMETYISHVNNQRHMLRSRVMSLLRGAWAEPAAAKTLEGVDRHEYEGFILLVGHVLTSSIGTETHGGKHAQAAAKFYMHETIVRTHAGALLAFLTRNLSDRQREAFLLARLIPDLQVIVSFSEEMFKFGALSYCYNITEHVRLLGLEVDGLNDANPEDAPKLAKMLLDNAELRAELGEQIDCPAYYGGHGGQHLHVYEWVEGLTDGRDLMTDRDSPLPSKAVFKNMGRLNMLPGGYALIEFRQCQPDYGKDHGGNHFKTLQEGPGRIQRMLAKLRQIRADGLPDDWYMHFPGVDEWVSSGDASHHQGEAEHMTLAGADDQSEEGIGRQIPIHRPGGRHRAHGHAAHGEEKRLAGRKVGSKPMGGAKGGGGHRPPPHRFKSEMGGAKGGGGHRPPPHRFKSEVGAKEGAKESRHRMQHASAAAEPAAANTAVPRDVRPYASFAEEMDSWRDKMDQNGCITSGYDNCTLPPELPLRALRDYKEHLQSDAKVGGRYCNVTRLPHPPSREEFIKGGLWKKAFIFDFTLAPNPMTLETVLHAVRSSHGSLDLDTDFGTLRDRKHFHNQDLLCDANATDAIQYIFTSKADQLQCRSGTVRCSDRKEREVACVDLRVQDSSAVEQHRAVGFGLSGIAPDNYKVILGQGGLDDHVVFDAPRELWRRGVARLGSLEAWGGWKHLKTDFRAHRPLFQGPGIRTPLHVDGMPQILSQFNGTKYIFLTAGMKPVLQEDMQRRLGYLDRQALEDAMLPGMAKFVAGCEITPGMALYLPPWMYHDVFTVEPSIMLGTRFTSSGTVPSKDMP